MKPARRLSPAWCLIWLAGVLFLQAACGGAALPTGAEPPGPAATEAPGEEPPISHSPTQIVAPTAPPATPLPAIAEARFVEIEWPAAIRVGDSDFILLSLVPGEQGALVPTAEVAGHQTEGEPIEIPNLYDTHNVLASAELSAVGLEIDRPGEIDQTLLPGEPAHWEWTVAPRSAGTHAATLALKLRFVPKAGGQASERAIWARRLSIEGRTVLGLSGRAADVFGVAGSVVGGVLGFPFADKLYAFLWRRLVKREA